MKFLTRRVPLLAVLLTCAWLSAGWADDSTARVTSGVLVLYDFSEAEGTVVHDRSGTQPLDLTINKSSNVRWVKGGLVIEKPTLISSLKPAKKLIEAVKKSGEITIEAWLTPAKTSQSGPARIVSLSADSSRRNFTLGQDADCYDIRLRATGSDTNGLPSTSGPKKSLSTQRTHVVFTRDRAGKTTLFVNGQVVTSGNVSGTFGNWDDKFPLSLANEVTGDRHWLGEFNLVAVYDRALPGNQVQQNYAAGTQTSSIASGQSVRATATSHNFETHVAPLLAKNCLECHDSAIKKGGLDLSRKDAALTGGDSGPAIVPGKADQSAIWAAVESNEMPKDRSPLTAQEKNYLRKWLEAGADWSIEVIDPAIFMHAGQGEQVWVQRLTVAEYIETVRSAVGVDISQEAKALLPADLRADGFSNTAYNLGVDLKHVEAYGFLAESIVGKMDVLKFAARFSKSRKLSTDDTLPDQVAAMGKWLLRGPLDKREVNSFSGIATTVASTGGDFEQAIGYIIQAMLQSPRFIYRIENQLGDGTPGPIEAYQLACRLSYIVWGGPPDEQLMLSAERGELEDRKQLAAQVQRMLKDPRAIERSLQFISQWLDLERLENLSPHADRFPTWNAQLADDMRAETLAFFKEVAWHQQRPLSDLLNAQVTFATPHLAQHYGLQPVGATQQKYDLSQVSGRGGLLTQGSVLTVGGDNASMVARGLFVLHDLLRGTINAPPPCVNTTPPPTKTGLTQRGIAEERIANETCGVCHARFEPLAFGLEKYDGIGAYHEQDEHGNRLRDDGQVLFPGEAQPVKYQSSAELMDLLANHDRVRESITWKVTQFALGRPLVASDAASVASIHQTAQQAGGTYSSLITAILLSDLVRTTRTERHQ